MDSSNNPLFEEGSIAPDWTLPELKTQELFQLSQLTQGNKKNVVLVFLRHLGWLPWREHVQQLHERKAELDILNARVLLISFVAGPNAHIWRDQVGIREEDYPFLLDMDRKLFHGYGMYSNEKEVWSLKVRFWYLIQKLRGKTLYEINGDPNQLGGDFVINSNGVCLMAFRSPNPISRPSVDSIIACLAKDQNIKDIQTLQSLQNSSPRNDNLQINTTDNNNISPASEQPKEEECTTWSRPTKTDA